MAFKMKGHELPGIKQFKSSALKDGRAGSSAFQQTEAAMEGKAEFLTQVAKNIEPVKKKKKSRLHAGTKKSKYHQSFGVDPDAPGAPGTPGFEPTEPKSIPRKITSAFTASPAEGDIFSGSSSGPNPNTSRFVGPEATVSAKKGKGGKKKRDDKKLAKLEVKKQKIIDKDSEAHKQAKEKLKKTQTGREKIRKKVQKLKAKIKEKAQKVKTKYTKTSEEKLLKLKRKKPGQYKALETAASAFGQQSPKLGGKIEHRSAKRTIKK